MKRNLFNLFTAIAIFTTSYLAYNQNSSARSLNEVIPYLKTTSSDSFAKQMDMDDLEGCSILTWQGEWKNRKKEKGVKCLPSTIKK
jgi:hypothetical protein